MISDTLKQLGFQGKEVDVYLEVLKRGKTTPAAVAKATGINRATVYSVSKGLLERGVLTEDLAGKSLYLVAKPADDLTVLIDRASKELNKKKRLVHDAIDELSQIASGTQYSIPRIRFIEDENVEDHLYKQISVWNESIMRAGSSSSSFRRTRNFTDVCPSINRWSYVSAKYIIGRIST